MLSLSLSLRLVWPLLNAFGSSKIKCAKKERSKGEATVTVNGRLMT